MDAGTVLLAASDLPGLEWFAGHVDETAGAPLLPGLGQEAGQPVAAACFETSYDALQAVERILVAAPLDGVEVSLALVAFGWGDEVDPADAAGAVTVGQCLLAAAPRGAAITCGSAAMVAGPLLGPSFELVWTEEIVRGPVNYERVFRIVAHGGESSGGPSQCLEWARRHAAGPLKAERLSAQNPVHGRLTVARADTRAALESEIARLALQAHARGDAVLRTDSRRWPRERAVPGNRRIVLLELMAKQLTQQQDGGSARVADLGRAPGFACLDELEAWLRAIVKRAPTTLVVPDVGSLDEISLVVIERLLQDGSLAGFSVITSHLGDAVPEVLRQLMSRVSRTDTVQLLVS
ncbi:hypothetical protein ACX80V_13665 [Arthrobacter sp. MDT3-24]